MLLSDEPFAARKIGDDFCGQGTADESAQGYGWYGHACRQVQVYFEEAYPQSEPEDVHQVHAEAEFGEFGYDAGSFRSFYAGEEQEGAAGCQYAVDGAHGPAQFDDRGGVDDSRNCLDVE